LPLAHLTQEGALYARTGKGLLPHHFVESLPPSGTIAALLDAREALVALARFDGESGRILRGFSEGLDP
jgi:hypothetical protein